MLEDLQGQIERVTFHNEETGFTIARLKVKGFRELITAVGNLMAPVPGQVLHATGEWRTHPQFGEQFKIVRYNTLVPATVAGIEKYLGSGLVKGIGPVMAKRIVKTFGKETLDVIEESVERLREVEGIGEKRVGMIGKAWSDQKEIREVMVFLQGHGVRFLWPFSLKSPSKLGRLPLNDLWEAIHQDSMPLQLSILVKSSNRAKGFPEDTTYFL